MSNRGSDEEIIDEEDKHPGGICETVKKGACAFIAPINKKQRVYVHNAHVMGCMPNKLNLRRVVKYMVQLDEFGRKHVGNCKIIGE